MAESCYLALYIVTAAVVVLTAMAYLKTKHLGFPVGMGLLYFWTLYGAWFVIADKSGADIGMDYSWIEDDLFSVYLDVNYLRAIVLYGVFLIGVILVVLLFARKSPSAGTAVSRPIVEIDHRIVLGLVFAASIISFVWVKEILHDADLEGLSAYTFKNNGGGNVSPVLTYYLVLNQAAIKVAMIGLAVTLSGPSARLIRGRSGRPVAAYCALLGALILINFAMGAKSALFGCGICAVLFYIANAEKPAWGRLTGVAAAGAFAMGLIDLLRGLAPSQLIGAVAGMSLGDMADAFGSLTKSTEMFAAHFSLYGVLNFHLPLIWGMTFLNLALSFVPRIFWPDRPDTYVYYANSVGANPNIGFTIHHATAWYMNFGVVGILMGAAALGGLWTYCFNARYSPDPVWAAKPWRRIFAALAPFLIVAYFPPLVRSPMEVYRPFVLETFVFPIALLCMAIAKGERASNFAGTPAVVS